MCVRVRVRVCVCVCVCVCVTLPQSLPLYHSSVGADGKSGKLPAPDTSNISAAVAVAKQADVAILFLGADQTTEAENFDRETLGLVGAQEQLLAAVTAVQKNVVVPIPPNMQWPSLSLCLCRSVCLV